MWQEKKMNIKPNITDNYVQQLLKNEDYCMAELCRIREAWEHKKTFTPEYIDASRCVMVGMLLYAPEKIHELVSSHLNELTMREHLYYSLPMKDLM